MSNSPGITDIPSQDMIPLILYMDLLNDDYLNTGVWPNLETYHSFPATASQLKISDFSGETF